MPAPLFAPLIALVVLGVAAGLLATQRRRQQRFLLTRLPAKPAGGAVDGFPDLLYFTGEHCTLCEVAQRPALARLRDLIGDVAIREIDVARDRSSARQYRVMTLPTTVVLDASGRATAVNAGFAGEGTLRDQVLAARTGAMEIAFD